MQSARQLIQTNDNLFQPRTLLTQRLRALGFIPDVGLLEFALDFGQTLSLAVVVKDTSSTHQCAQ